MHVSVSYLRTPSEHAPLGGISYPARWEQKAPWLRTIAHIWSSRTKPAAVALLHQQDHQPLAGKAAWKAGGAYLLISKYSCQWHPCTSPFSIPTRPARSSFLPSVYIHKTQAHTNLTLNSYVWIKIHLFNSHSTIALPGISLRFPSKVPCGNYAFPTLATTHAQVVALVI